MIEIIFRENGKGINPPKKIYSDSLPRIGEYIKYNNYEFEIRKIVYDNIQDIKNHVIIVYAEREINEEEICKKQDASAEQGQEDSSPQNESLESERKPQCILEDYEAQCGEYEAKIKKSRRRYIIIARILIFLVWLSIPAIIYDVYSSRHNQDVLRTIKIEREPDLKFDFQPEEQGRKKGISL